MSRHRPKFVFVDSSRNSHVNNSFQHRFSQNLCMDESPPEAGSARFRDPSKLFFQADSIRRSIISAYWLIILLALPLWWSTTSIERLSLPSSRVASQAQNKLNIPIRINLQDHPNGASLAPHLQRSLDEHITKMPERWKGLDVYLSSAKDLGMYSPKTSHLS